MWSMFSLLTDANLISMELVSKYSSLRAFSMYLSYITTNNKREVCCVSLRQQHTRGHSMCRPSQRETTFFMGICQTSRSHRPKTRFYTKGRPLVKSNLICPSDKLSWQTGCPLLNINIQGNFHISQGNGSSDNLPDNLVWTPEKNWTFWMFPVKSQWRRALMFSLISTWTNGTVNNREIGDWDAIALIMTSL